MARWTIASYLSIPTAVAIGGLILALRYEPFDLGAFASAAIGGFLYYAAPLLVWALIVTIAGFSGPVAHAGFGAAAVALLLIAALSLAGRDSSGLPIQWLMYWPLAFILQAVCITGAALYVRLRPRFRA